MTQSFRKGDLMICIDPAGSGGMLVEGSLYCVTDVLMLVSGVGEYVRAEDVAQPNGTPLWHRSRFAHAKDPFGGELEYEGIIKAQEAYYDANGTEFL